MTDTHCCIEVGPVIPQDFFGQIFFPELVSVDSAGVETPYNGTATIISVKPTRAEYPFPANVVAGAPDIVISESPGFFSHIYKQMEWRAKSALYESLYWRIGGELYDCLLVTFSSVGCVESGTITYEPKYDNCPPCNDPGCP